METLIKNKIEEIRNGNNPESEKEFAIAQLEDVQGKYYETSPHEIWNDYHEKLITRMDKGFNAIKEILKK